MLRNKAQKMQSEVSLDQKHWYGLECIMLSEERIILIYCSGLEC
jgi:hypothetical protein